PHRPHAGGHAPPHRGGVRIAHAHGPLHGVRSDPAPLPGARRDAPPLRPRGARRLRGGQARRPHLEPDRRVRRHPRSDRDRRAPGPWLNALKHASRTGAPDDTPIQVTPGDRRPLGALGAELITVTPGQKVAYVVDTLSSPANPAAIVRLAAGADLFFCEAPFLEEDLEQAARRYHLTARQAGALAR